MAYRVGSGETGALGIQYDDRDRDAANVRNQATQINAQQAAEARRLAAAKAAQDAAAAAQMYGDDKRYALGMNTIDANAKISGTAEDTRAHALRLEDMRQAPDIRKADEDRRRYDMERNDGAAKRALEDAKVRGTMQYVDRFTGGGRGGGPSASPSMGGAMGGMAAGAGAAGVMDPTDQALMAELSEADMAGMAFLSGDFGGYLQNRGNEKNAARERDEAKSASDRERKTKMAESAIQRGDPSGYKSYADASDGLFTEEQARAGMAPRPTLAGVLPTFQSMAKRFSAQDNRFFGFDPSEEQSQELLDAVETMTSMIMRESNVPEQQARQMAVEELRRAMAENDKGFEDDMASDRTADFFQRARGQAPAAPAPGSDRRAYIPGM